MSERSDHRAEAEKLLRAMSEVEEQYIEDAAGYGDQKRADAVGGGDQKRADAAGGGVQKPENVAGYGSREVKSGSSVRKIRRIRRWIGIAAAACLFAAVIGRWVSVMNRPSMATSDSYVLESENAANAEEAAAEAEAAEDADTGTDNGIEEAAEDADTGTYNGTEAAAEDADTLANPYVEVNSLSEAAEITGFELQVPDAEEPYTSMVIDVIDGTMIQVSYFNADETEEGCYIRKAAGEEDISGDYNDYADIITEEVDGMSVTLKGNDGTWSVAVWSADGYAYAIGAQEHPLTEEQMLGRIREIR